MSLSELFKRYWYLDLKESCQRNIDNGEWSLGRDWVGRHYLWEEMEFNSYSDYAVYNLHIAHGGWKIV